ncbi:MAG: arylesterase [Opitutales bacterium]
MHRFLSLLQITVLFCWATPSNAELGAGETGSILFFGDSLTAAYGLDETQGYPALIGDKIKQEGLPWETFVGAVSGDTSAGGLRRIDWMLQRKVDIFVLALGANDGLRGTELSSTRDNLQQTIDRVLKKYPSAEVIIAGMQMPPNLGAKYTEEFAALFPELAEKNKAHLIPFLLEGVAANNELNQEDIIHPTAEGQKVIAENVWKVLRPLLD